MMSLLDDFALRLAESAKAIGWSTAKVPSLTESRFRGQLHSDEQLLPLQKLGLQLGNYPVILASLALSEDCEIAPQLRALHSQVLIARSYLSPDQVVDLHLFLAADLEELTPRQRIKIDRLERDEAICRKLVWIVGQDPDRSFASFIERTFLAQPWQVAPTQPRQTFQLDKPADLLGETLVKQGLSPRAAEAWVRLAERYIQSGRTDPAQFIESLVSVMDSTDE